MSKHKLSGIALVVGGNRAIEKLFDQFIEVSSNINKLFHNSTIEKVKLVVFTGGEDVHPRFYGGVDCGISMTNTKRDVFERYVFRKCMINNIKTTGICRGFQFLNVMTGGFMYQHIKGHAGLLHRITYPSIGLSYQATSTHHQLVGLSDSALPIAWAAPKLSKEYIGKYGNSCIGPSREIEAAVFPEFNSMGVQFHPEFVGKHAPSRIHYLNMIKEFLYKDIDDFTEKYAVRRKINDKKGREKETTIKS